MAHAVDLDFGPGSNVPFGKSQERITARFNVALFAFLGLMGFVRFLLVASMAQKSTSAAFLLSGFLDAVRFLAVVLISSAFLKEFWVRLVTSLFPVRAIAYEEAVAILLMISLVFGA